MSQKKITFLYGPTGSGKTAYALDWAKKTGGNILSVDSRQIYKNFSVVVGKDLPDQATWQEITPIGLPAWQLPGGQYLWGLDIVHPTEPFTVSHWYSWVKPIIEWHRSTDTPLILAGGTWPWMSVLISPPESLFAPPDEALRKLAENMSVEQLQARVLELSPERWSQLNDSDRHNRRRLTRLIEVLPLLEKNAPSPLVEMNEFSILLKDTSLQEVESAIWQRVLQRWEDGAVEETKKLMELYPDWNFPAFSATGYKALREYIEESISQDEAIQIWVQSERGYAKRQITWMRLIQKQYSVTLV